MYLFNRSSFMNYYLWAVSPLDVRNFENSQSQAIKKQNIISQRSIFLHTDRKTFNYFFKY